MPTVFYAWQSDAPAAINRYLIRDALEQALDQVNIALQIDDALDVDSDTQGVPGSPPVAETILKKIDECMIVVVDLTLVGKTISAESQKEKQVPNANVLIELGYTLARHGHGALIQVMNTHFGPPEALPFDLAHRRHPIRYELSPDATLEEKKRVRAELAGNLRRALRTFLDDRTKAQQAPASPLSPEERVFAGRGMSAVILEQGDERFRSRIAELAVTLPSHGSFEVALKVFGWQEEFHADRDFLTLITNANPDYRNWPLWMNPASFTDPSVKPKARDGLWETALILLDAHKWRAPSVDYWFASPLGNFYHRRALWEDGLWPATAHRPYQTGTVLDLTQQIAVVAEAFVVGQAFANAMGVPETAPHIDFAFRWTGLKNRVLVSSTQQQLFLDEYRAEDNEGRSTCYLPVNADRTEILDRVIAAIRPLANKFSGYPPNERVLKESANAFLDKRILQL